MHMQKGSIPASGDTRVYGDELLPVFQQGWWLDAVCGKKGWENVVLLESHRAGPLVWPVCRRNFGPFQYLSLPPFTQQLYWQYDPAAEYRDTHFFERNFRALMYRLALPDTTENRYLLEGWGFDCREGFTYRIDCPDTIEAAWANVSPTSRALIKKADAALTVRRDEYSDTLYELVEKSHLRHGIGAGVDADTCARMVQACRERDQGGVFLAEDAQGRAYAAVFVVWDHQNMYYLLAGMEDQFDQKGAPRLLIWHTMQMAFARNLSYDFHGGMPPAVGSVYASMGAKPAPYLRAVRYRPAVLGPLIQTAKRMYAPHDHLFH